MTGDNNRGAGCILLQVFNAVDQIRSVIGKVENNDTESCFLQALSGFLNTGRGTDGIIRRQGVSQNSGFIFILSDKQQPGVFLDLVLCGYRQKITNVLYDI